jgi:hypothetical protein
VKIALNGLELSRQAEGETTVGDVLTELHEEIRVGGKIVTQVSVDGQLLGSGWQRRKLLTRPVNEVARLDLNIEEPLRLKQQTLDDAAGLVGRMVSQIPPLGKKFRVGDEVTANNDLASFLEDMKLVLAGLDYTTRASGAARRTPPVRSRVMDTANRLLPTLDRIYKAQAAGDYIAIADEIEYDLMEQMTQWPTLVNEARQSLDAPEQVG